MPSFLLSGSQNRYDVNSSIIYLPWQMGPFETWSPRNCPLLKLFLWGTLIRRTHKLLTSIDSLYPQTHLSLYLLKSSLVSLDSIIHFKIEIVQTFHLTYSEYLMFWLYHMLCSEMFRKLIFILKECAHKYSKYRFSSLEISSNNYWYVINLFTCYKL